MNFDKSLGNIGQYQDDQGVWREVNNEFVPAIAPWNFEMLKAGYHVRVKEDFTSGQILQFEKQGETVEFQPMALEWTNDLDQIQQISMPQNVSPNVTNPPSEIIPNSFDGTITWGNGYGTGRHFAWECTPRRLNKVLKIDSLASLPTPQQYIIDGGNPVLRLNLIFDPSSDVDVFVDGQLWDKKVKVQTPNLIEFRKNGKVLWSFMPLMYQDSAGNEGQSVATLEKSGNNLYISIRVPYTWLQSATYPVFIDADIQIEATVAFEAWRSMGRSGTYWTSTTVGYTIYSNSSKDIVYRKTVNGGATWGAAMPIVPAGSCYSVHMDCWADWQTVGDAGTKIHIVYLSIDTNEARYVYLDTSTDTVGGDDLIETCRGTGTIWNQPCPDNNFIAITKARGGNLCVIMNYTDDGSTKHHSFYTSPDADTWTEKTHPMEHVLDFCWIYPGNEADNQDIWGIYYDKSVFSISLKTYDDSADNWTEQAISVGVLHADFTAIDGAIRFSDGHLLLAHWNAHDAATADLLTFDINGAGSIVAKTNVLTDSAESVLVSVFINQDTDDVYVCYARGTAVGSDLKIFYKVSNDGMGTWSGETAMQADAEDNEGWIGTGAVKAAWGGFFQPVWINHDLKDLFCNTDNDVAIPASGDGVEVADKTAHMAAKMIAAGLIC